MQGKRFLITGASGGIGRAICRKLATGRNSFILHGGRNLKALQALKTEVERADCTAELWLQDFTTSPEIEDQKMLNLLENVDVFIHCSGHSLYKMLIDTSTEEWDALFNVHIKSAYLISKNILPRMVRNKWGRLILISSIWGEVGASCEVAYSTVKGAVNGFTKSLAKELAPSGITVNAIAPGVIETPMVLDQFNHDELIELKNEIPVGRLGLPVEVAELVKFLSSEESAYITGQIIHINGGWR